MPEWQYGKVGFRPMGLPRRSRLLLIAMVLFCAFVILPKSGSRPGNPLLSYLDISASRKPEAPDWEMLDYVDPLIGTANGGHVFPGASLPYGMAKAVADTLSPAENAGGFVSDDKPVVGFSQMHDSGTGGNPSLGNFPLFVHAGCPEDDFARCRFAAWSRMAAREEGTVQASPGYFSLNLTNSVAAEMTAAEHTTLFRFGFPGTATVRTPTGWEEEEVEVPYSPLVVVDLVDLANSRTTGGVEVRAGQRRVVGEGRFSASFGRGGYQAFFCADFRGATLRRSGTFMSDKATEDRSWFDSTGSGFRIPRGSAGAWLQFTAPEEDSLLARVGLSFLSADQACENAEREIPDFDFETTRAAARAKWAEKLSAVRVDTEGVSEELQKTFWSGLYRSFLMPQNYTGENQLWNSSEPYYDSFYCIWDSFRAQHPLLTVVDPGAQTEMIRTLIDIYRNVGKLPDCRMSFSKGYSQGGSNADVMLADAYVKGLKDGIDWETAYEAVVSDAEVEPRNWGLEGRGNLESWHRLGFIPVDDEDRNGTGPASRTVSRTVEYAYEDFCISLMAAGMGRAAEAGLYRTRSGNWRNVWNAAQRDVLDDRGAEVEQSEFRGFVQPRLANGTFARQEPRTCSPASQMHSCYFDTSLSTYEGSPWLYSFFVPQDMAGLVTTVGGPEAFAKRLSYFHAAGISYLGNEPGFLPVFQFHYAGRPGLSSYWAHRYIPEQFNASLNGLPGNDDCAMGAFAALAFMGFFPVAGQDVYLLIPPFFREVSLRTPTGRRAVIRVRNFDPTYKAKFVRSATLDGRPYTRSWITHDFFVRGGVLELTVAQVEGTWGTLDRDLPPSYGGRI